MKILAFTDTHFDDSVPEKLVLKTKEADVVACAGDFTQYGRNINKIMKDFLKFGKPFVFVHGNHEEGEDFKEYKKYKDLKFIHKKGYVFGDYLFVGFGGGGFSEKYDELEAMIPLIKKRKKDKKVIFVTHAPVYGTTTDFVDWAGHVGSKSALRFVKEIKPVAVICGHIEENVGQIDVIGKTVVINPGDEGRIIEV